MTGAEMMVVESTGQFTATYLGMLGVFALSAIGILRCTAVATMFRRLSGRRWVVRNAFGLLRAPRQPERRLFPMALGQDPWGFGWVVADLEPSDSR